MVRELVTLKSVLTWDVDEDGTPMVVKRLRSSDPFWLGRFANEAVVNRLLDDQPPPCRRPALLAESQDPPCLTFEAIAGDPVAAERYPQDLPVAVERLIDLAVTLSGYRPVSPALETWDPRHVLASYLDRGIATREDAELVLGAIESGVIPTAFAHGDFMPMNLLLAGGELVVADWEFARWYPVGYDLAHLRSVLIRHPGGQELVECHVRRLAPADALGFWLGAVSIGWRELWLTRHDDDEELRDLLRRGLEASRRQLRTSMAAAGLRVEPSASIFIPIPKSPMDPSCD